MGAGEGAQQPDAGVAVAALAEGAQGVLQLDLGGSAAQSVVLMVIVTALTVVQFRFIERRIHYT